MELNPNIILSGDKPRSVIESYTNLQQLKTGQQQAELGQLQLQKAKTDMADEAGLRRATKEATSRDPSTGEFSFDDEKFVNQLAALGHPQAYEVAVKIKKNALELSKLERDNLKAQIEARKAQVDEVGQIYSSAVDAPSYVQMIDTLRERYPEHFPIDAPAVWSKETAAWLDLKRQQFLGNKQRFDLFHQKQMEEFTKASQAETARHNVATETQAARSNDIAGGARIDAVVAQTRKDFEAQNEGFKKLRAHKQTIDSWAQNLDDKFNYKKGLDGKKVDAGFADSLAVYGFSKIRDELGAVLAGDIKVSLAGRTMVQDAMIGLDKLANPKEGRLLSNAERRAIVTLTRDIYKAKEAQVEQDRSGAKEFIGMRGGDPNVMDTILPTEASEARRRAAAESGAAVAAAPAPEAGPAGPNAVRAKGGPLNPAVMNEPEVAAAAAVLGKAGKAVTPEALAEEILRAGGKPITPQNMAHVVNQLVTE